jgi:phosphate:Na+ symporter
VPRHLPLILALAFLAWAFWSSPTLTEIAAGIAIFLFGMISLERGFRTFTGGTLETLLRKSTDRLWKGLAFGAVATTVTQSSTLVTLITITFLSAGLMGLQQGIGVIFGANLGTTTGAWLMAGFGIRVNISAYAMPLLVFGLVLGFNRSRTIKGLGHILTGVGFLFLGIHFMREGFDAFQDTIDLSQFAVAGITGLLLYTALGMLATVVMQSSHATLILTIAALAAGQVTYDNALALSIGANIGTTITALIGAVGANIEGRRLAGAHLVFNLVTAVIALAFIQMFMAAVDTVSAWLGIAPDNHMLKLALFHSLFNLVGIVVMVPFIPVLVRGLETWLKPKPVIVSEPKYIRPAMLEVPGAALEATRRELIRLFERIFKTVAAVLNYEPAELRQTGDREALLRPPARVHEHEVEDVYLRKIKPLHGQIVDYLARIPARNHRIRQLVALRTASQDLVEAIKDTKHLQKNLFRYLRSTNPAIRDEYLQIRANLGWLLGRLEALSREPGEDLELSLAELGAHVESDDIVTNGHLDQLIRERRISPEQATSLMNDSAYAYRIASNLIAAARATFLPFGEVDDELREELALESGELRAIVTSSGDQDSRDGGQES